MCGEEGRFRVCVGKRGGLECDWGRGEGSGMRQRVGEPAGSLHPVVYSCLVAVRERQKAATMLEIRGYVCFVF